MEEHDLALNAENRADSREPGDSPANATTRGRRGVKLHEFPILAQAWVALLVVDILLRRRGFETLRRSSLFRAGDVEPPSRQVVDRLYHLVAIAGRRHLYPMLCLRRTLVLQWLLARRGVPAVLRLGVERTDGEIGAHAWLEWEGVAIGEPRELAGRYVVLTREGEAS